MAKSRRKVAFVEHHPFFQCCANSVKQLNEHDMELMELVRSTGGREMTAPETNQSFYLQHQVEMYEVSAPIFAITTAENFINLYSESLIEGNHFHSAESLESLGLLSKWVVIPFIACGNELDKDSSAMKEFQELIKVRNNLIHARPVRLYNINDEQLERASKRFDNRSKDRRRIAKRADKIIVNLLAELLSIDDREELLDLIDDLKIPVICG